GRVEGAAGRHVVAAGSYQPLAPPRDSGYGVIRHQIGNAFDTRRRTRPANVGPTPTSGRSAQPSSRPEPGNRSDVLRATVDGAERNSIYTQAAHSAHLADRV